MKRKTIVRLLIAVFSVSLMLQACSEGQETVDVTDVVINIKSVAMVKGETVQLRAVVKPSNATDPMIEWESVDEDVATVDNTGLVQAVGAGKTIIIARSSGLASECDVAVGDVPVDGLTLDKDVLELNLGETGALTATVTPEMAENYTVSWSSSNSKVATVDQNGMIMTLASGETVVKAECGEVLDSCYVYVMGEPQIGDYYYPDGRWYSTPITGQTPVAIIFYVGDPTEDDIALRNDHPECTNGLAVALFSEKSSVWQSKAAVYGKLISDWAKEDPEASQYIDVHQSKVGEHLNSIMGYNNTKVYELFNADPANAEWPVEAVSVIEEVREEIHLPENTSGWYIPSAKELSLMCSGEYDDNIGSMNESSLLSTPMIDNLSFLNSRIFQIPGAFLFSPDYYLSSTEADKVIQMYSTTYNQWHIKMTTGYVFNQAKTGSSQVIRPIFAF
ncbi:MAG TPA: Ig-like domain-containing protein [Candidatus Coprenecus stercoravium]|uniref:Ig-like domain-containing protein n=1 Tax=Candidatus Coprenecus stercoravium TaxID=2840735 RepID=A0A9D2GQ59_9BACT|nr:Ig-like domain-containing protein [Candidatus Coprenecus stercoravium]